MMNSFGVVLLLFFGINALVIYYSNCKAKSAYRKILNDKFNHYKKYLL